MTKRVLRAVISQWLFLTSILTLPASAQETSGQILAKLQKLSPESRQKVLVEQAKVEKEVTFYSSLQTTDAEPFLKAFNYPSLSLCAGAKNCRCGLS